MFFDTLCDVIYEYIYPYEKVPQVGQQFFDLQAK